MSVNTRADARSARRGSSGTVKASFAAIGSVGAGYSAEALEASCARGASFIGADAGSSDSGPFQLGGLGTNFPEEACRRDLSVALRCARRYGIPLVVGSCGGSGTDSGVDWFARLIREIVEADGLAPFRLARIYSEPSRDYLKEQLRAGRIHALPDAPHYDERAIDASERIVGFMGVEPIVRALEGGAEVVLAGRSSDPSIWAALPTMHGVDPAIAWHAAKLCECGGAAAWPPRLEIMHADLYDDHFVVEPTHPDLRCTPTSVAQHQLYENGDPYVLREPAGQLELHDVSYEAVSDRAVHVRGAKWAPAQQYTVKLEGVERTGYQKLFLVSIRDPALVENLNEWLAHVDEAVERRVLEVFDRDVSSLFEVHTRRYGVDGTLGAWEPDGRVAKEILFAVDVVAHTDELAATVASIIWFSYIHAPISTRKGFVTIAWPFNPHIIDRGPVYRFNVNHIVEVDDPMDFFRLQFEEVS